MYKMSRPFLQTTAHPYQRAKKIIPLPLLIFSRCQARQTLEISVEIRCISESIPRLPLGNLFR